jgi:hypothetical protein
VWASGIVPRENLVTVPLRHLKSENERPCLHYSSQDLSSSKNFSSRSAQKGAEPFTSCNSPLETPAILGPEPAASPGLESGKRRKANSILPLLSTCQPRNESPDFHFLHVLTLLATISESSKPQVNLVCRESTPPRRPECVFQGVASEEQIQHMAATNEQTRKPA